MVKIRHSFINFALLSATVLGLGSCAHTAPPSGYIPTRSTSVEIQKLDLELNALAQESAADLLSPSHFLKAREKLADAKKEQEKGKEQKEVMSELMEARDHFAEAQRFAIQGSEMIPEVLSARNNAITVNSSQIYPKKFHDAESDLKSLGKAIENGKSLSSNERNELQRKYMDVELLSIKKTRLGVSEANLAHAKDMKAQKYAPKTLTEAEAKYKSAESVIEADRSNLSVVDRAVDISEKETTRLVAVTQIIKNSDGKTDEASAIAIVDQRREIAKNEANLRAKDESLHNSAASNVRQAGVLASVKRENQDLSTESRFNQQLTEAQNLFPKEEAEAYRQGDRLVLRLKKIGFASGKSDLPQSSLATLAKVKEVVNLLKAERVIVEGHTDSIGGKEANTNLSQGRANAVKEYLISQDVLNDDSVEAHGFGFENPIAPNKTKAGRAQNRRVDVIITPAQG